jgi:catechol 2,3-dioxygenase-like lactoylglutathione lyase family enzyme
MIPFVTIGTNKLAQACQFYDALLGALHFERTRDDERWIAYGPRGTGKREIFLGAPYAGNARAGNGIMVAICADTEADVRNAHAAGLRAGGANEGDPAYRPVDSKWFGAYLRDLDGNKICICVDD